MSEMFNGPDIQYVYKGTKGTSRDSGESFLQKCGFSMRPDQLMTSYVKQIFDGFDKLDPNKKIRMLVLCHSQGGIITYNAGRDLNIKFRKRMDIATFGSATTIPRRIFGEAINYFNRTDFIPWTDPIGRSGLLNNSNIVIFDDCGFGEHGLLQKSYSRGIRKVKEDYENYFY